MRRLQFIVLAVLVMASVASPVLAEGIPQGPLPGRAMPIRVVLVNMSGKSREAHLGHAVVALPVAEKVVLQVMPGEKVTITSATDRHVDKVMMVSAVDGGRVIPVQ
ncbi:hypothetical protein SAMN05421819_2478 [Bryocella elongata]|uniref:Uncharacterized protein n=1 Tax=Bryocella elongata TaxID=863522 RepID=A0A1H5Z635_9BACT|nr:hypothetical protein [Bryocella elongata]SEG31752.1 hypothetical protein SAMN05421819_2478 [Bryocella elongata]